MKPPIGSPSLPRSESEYAAGSDDSVVVSGTGEAPAGSRPKPPLGSPYSAEQEFVPVSEETAAAIDAQERRSSEEHLPEQQDSLTVLTKLKRLNMISGGLVFLLGLVLIAFVGLVTFSQALLAIAYIRQLPNVLQVASWTVLIALLVAILFPAARLAHKLAKFRAAQQINLQDLDRLDSRFRLRGDAAARTSHSVEKLDRYLAEYPNPRSVMSPLGIEESQIAELESDLDRLRSEERDLSDTRWIRDFEHSFHAGLEKVAVKRIHDHALRAAVGTGLSPIPLVDSLVVLNAGFRMIDDLCTIYNLRMGTGATTVVLLLAGSQSILAGKIEDSDTLRQVGDDLHGNILDPLLTRLGLGASDAIARPLIGMAGQGLLHYVLLRRIGMRAQGWLRVVRRDD